MIRVSAVYLFRQEYSLTVKCVNNKPAQKKVNFLHYFTRANSENEIRPSILFTSILRRISNLLEAKNQVWCATTESMYYEHGNQDQTEFLPPNKRAV